MKSNIPVRLVKSGFKFESSHRLMNYKGACAKWHGHSYKMTVAVEGVPNPESGLTADFKDLKAIVNETIINEVDHSNLNKTMTKFSLDGNTTCENMIIAFWWALDHAISEAMPGVNLVELKLWETEDSHAILTRDMVYNAE